MMFYSFSFLKMASIMFYIFSMLKMDSIMFYIFSMLKMDSIMFYIFSWLKLAAMMARLGFPMGKLTAIQVKQIVKIFFLRSSIFVSCG
jgi:hypothetical protein